MGPRLLILVTTICVYLSHFTVEARKGGGSNNVIKTIKMEDGLYDCYDFYKQPSLQHPLLKNHSFHPEMRPITQITTTFSNEASMDVKHTEVDCPKGTVPIRRLSKEYQLLQAQLRREHYAHLGGICPKNNNERTHNYAIAQSKCGQNGFYGIGASLSVHNPQVTSSQYSSSEIIIKGGADVLLTGWTVNPMVYKDNQTRMFTYAVVGGSHCFNTVCGFVQVNTQIPLDSRIEPVSIPYGKIYAYPFFIYQDTKSGNWWLVVGQKNTAVGFWPQSLFQGLQKPGSFVACGGEVYDSNVDKLHYPPMGWGDMPTEYTPPITWPHCRDIRVANEQLVTRSFTDLDAYTTDLNNYFIGLSEHSDIAAYGGPTPGVIRS